ncbi:MAG TPA: NYN domain-containing protein [Jatrophihabitantaceae bacterium]|jgi:predicted RNA-binding protein with PIN domain|nr:NYN domain-containing protein [Jatrophihabitantaceae bacterium]
MSALPDSGGTTPVVLAEPVRARVIQIASDVLGRLPADEVPPPLRAIARFTPAKRIRLGAAALSAALDADEEFRARVAQAVIDAAPQLADAVRDQEATTASDPIDTAVVAYLTRPDGWLDVVADVGTKWAEARAGRDAAAEDLARLRGELAELRSQLKAEKSRVEAAATAASAAASDEATRLRNMLRSRTADLRAAEGGAAQAQATAEAARAELEAVQAAHAAELRRVRARTVELERAIETSRRDNRTGRDVNDARLRLLLDTLTEAAAGVRRELALPPGALRPADTVAAAEGADGAATVGEPLGLDRLLELPQVHLIVDGYNVTKTGYAELALADQRTRLILAMATMQSRSNVEVTVVFDGGARPPAQPRTPRGVRVLFSAPNELADDLIRRLVAAEPAGRPLVVVTSDKQVVADVRRSGAWTVPSAVLVQRLS